MKVKWYSDENMAIFFSDTPKPIIRYPYPNIKDSKLEEIEEKPFLNTQEFKIALFDLNKSKRYGFTAPKDYTWDGATIPRFVWSIVGAKTDPAFLIPSLIHDLLCENHHFVNGDRYFSTCVFERLLYVSQVPAWKRWFMKHTVDNFQKTQNWEEGIKCLK